MATLSQELIDEILGYLWEDAGALRTCSLICRSFTPACQKELFSSVAVVVDADGGRKSLPIPSTQKLLALIESSPRIARYVKSLKIIGGLGHKSARDDCRLTLILPLFHRLTAFAIEAKSRQFPPIFLVPIRNVLRLPSLMQVELGNMPFELIPCGASFNHLSYSNLLDSCAIRSPKDHAHADPAQSTKLISLHLANPSWNPRKFFDTLLSSTILDVSHVRRLYLNFVEMPVVAHGLAEQFLRACSNTLEVLKLNPSSVCARWTEEEIETGHPDTMYFFDIGCLFALRHLQIRLQINYWGRLVHLEPDVVSSPYPWFLHILKAIPITNRLEELSILNVYASPLNSLPDEIEYVPWDKLVPLLSENFPCLRKVNFLLEVSPDLWALRKIVNATHPMAVDFQRSGILEIREVPADHWDPYESRPHLIRKF
ncbi:hypothetical protein BDZ97DRAFT_1840195 [Flammula alnicola]|nr:hypothetical protein BDZ97DRAFT_1840195 [Flammula alnicola]